MFQNSVSGLIFTEPSLRVWLPPVQKPAASQLGAGYCVLLCATLVASLLSLQRVHPSNRVLSFRKNLLGIYWKKSSCYGRLGILEGRQLIRKAKDD